MSVMTAKLKRIGQRQTWDRFISSLKYSLYVIVHPIDGFWDLIHEKRGSLAAANILVLFTLLTHIWKLQFTSFQFIQVHWERVNIFMESASVLVPLFVFCVSNWGVTTLFDGKGRLSQIYMGTAYALTPYIIIQIPLIFLSNIVTVEEGTFYWFFSNFSLVWVGVLIIAAMMMIHAYSFGKTLWFMIVSAFAMLVFIFIVLLFFSMISDGIAYFISLGREILFRLN
jgi:hypothetical protein